MPSNKQLKTQGKRFYENDAIAKALKNSYGDLPIVDATANIVIIIQPVDIKGAVPCHPGKCALSRGSKRQCGCKNPQFWKTVAFLDMVDDDGIRKVFRFYLGHKAQGVVRDLDMGLPVAPGTVVTLKAPGKYSRQLRNLSAALRKASGVVSLRRRKPRSKKAIEIAQFVRCGTGRCKFPVAS